MHPAARTSIAVLSLAAALGLAACGSSSVPTQAPASAAPSVSAAPPVDAPSSAPSDAAPLPSAVDPTPVGGQPEAPGVVITALNIAFDPQAVTVPANVPLTLLFDNQDAGIPHDIQVSDANGNVLVKSDIITGPNRIQVALPALGPGSYTFVCVVHPNMTGTITAQ